MLLLRPLRLLPASVVNGLTISVGALAVASAAGAIGGMSAAVSASSGYAAVGVADNICAPRGKASNMLPAVLSAIVVSWLVGLSSNYIWAETLMVLAVTFSALLWTAWGKRGMPQSFVMILSLIFQMAAFHEAPLQGAAAFAHLGWVAMGAAAMGGWAWITNYLLASHYRALALADSLTNLSRLIRTQSGWTLDRAKPDAADSSQNDLLSLIRQQAGLADVFQSSRDLLYADAQSAHDVKRRQQIDAMIHVVNLRDIVLGCQLDIEHLPTHPTTRTALLKLSHFFNWVADQIEVLANAVRMGDPPPPDQAAPVLLAPDDDRNLQSLARRATHLLDHSRALSRSLAAPHAGPHPEAGFLHTLVSPDTWHFAQLKRQMHLGAPTMRYALRATLAMACALVVSHFFLPWDSHPHWLLLTVAVVMRGSLEQTLARRDARIIGTLVGCGLASALLSLHPSMSTRFVVLSLSMGLAHAFALRDYRVTTAFAAVMALLQANLFAQGEHAVWLDAAERLADTLIGALIAWGFSYVLPSWERTQLPSLVLRLRRALARYAHHVLHWQEGPALLPERTHARREVYDAIWLLAQALQRTVKEPSYAGNWTPKLESLLIRSHRLISQLAVVRIVLMYRNHELNLNRAHKAIQSTELALQQLLSDAGAPAESSAEHHHPDTDLAHAMPAPFGDPTPWLERRLKQIEQEAAAWAEAANGIVPGTHH